VEIYSSKTTAWIFKEPEWGGGIEFVEVEDACVGLEIYSSKIAAWIFKESEWGGGIVLRSKLRVFFLMVLCTCLSTL
jgi:hypothetical protein